MNKLIVQGGNKLQGEICVHGAKNSSLPLLAATILSNSVSVIHNCPILSDVDAACKILNYLGCVVERDGHTISIDTTSLTHFDVPDELMCEMRSSIVFLGAIVARMGRTRISFPGGCELGPRPIDLHLAALRKLGLHINEEHGYLDCYVNDRLVGAKIALAFPSVGATENIILAAATAKGETIITNAASEPEIVDLANFLNACGAKIKGAGESTIIIEGVKTLTGAEHTVISDRIVAATYLCSAAVTNGEILIRDVDPTHLQSVLPVFEQAGCKVFVEQNSIYLKGCERLFPLKNVRTMPYPGFPTDAQAPLMAVSAIADGTSVFVENIFENRFKHTSELVKMGASIKVEGKVAVVEGVKQLSGAQVRATDLRGGAALVVAGLTAKGKTIIHDVKHIDRGYESIEQNLSDLGAKLWRE